MLPNVVAVQREDHGVVLRYNVRMQHGGYLQLDVLLDAHHAVSHLPTAALQAKASGAVRT